MMTHSSWPRHPRIALMVTVAIALFCTALMPAYGEVRNPNGARAVHEPPDVQVYIEEAKWHWVHNRHEDAKTILTEAMSILEDLSIVEVHFNFDPDQILFSQILDSLETSGGAWTCPPWCLRSRYLERDNHIVIWDTEGPFSLRFSRYGFEEVTTDYPPRSTTIPVRTMDIKPTIVETRNVLTGTVRLADRALRTSRIEVWLVDSHGSNRGFSMTTMTDTDGVFSLTDIPNGNFELSFSNPGYVRYSLSIELQNGDLRCLIDSRRHYHHPGVTRCNLHELDIQLHPIHEVTLRWLLQDDPGDHRFPSLDAVQEVRLSSALPYDWRRGGWGCCESTFKFGSATIDAPSTDPDLVIFTDTDGVLYFGQPYNQFIASQFIASVSEYFEVLDDVPPSLIFRETAKVTEGRTYVLNTNPGKTEEVNLVKMEVTEVHVRAP